MTLSCHGIKQGLQPLEVDITEKLGYLLRKI